MTKINRPKNITVVAAISIVLSGLTLISVIGFLIVKGPGILTILDTRLTTDAMLMKPSTNLMLSLTMLLAVLISSIMMLKGKKAGWIAYLASLGGLCFLPFIMHLAVYVVSRPFHFNIMALAGVIMIIAVSRKASREYFAG